MLSTRVALLSEKPYSRTNHPLLPPRTGEGTYELRILPEVVVPFLPKLHSSRSAGRSEERHAATAAGRGCPGPAAQRLGGSSRPGQEPAVKRAARRRGRYRKASQSVATPPPPPSRCTGAARGSSPVPGSPSLCRGGGWRWRAAARSGGRGRRARRGRRAGGRLAACWPPLGWAGGSGGCSAARGGGGRAAGPGLWAAGLRREAVATATAARSAWPGGRVPLSPCASPGGRCARPSGAPFAARQGRGGRGAAGPRLQSPPGSGARPGAMPSWYVSRGSGAGGAERGGCVGSGPLSVHRAARAVPPTGCLVARSRGLLQQVCRPARSRRRSPGKRSAGRGGQPGATLCPAPTAGRFQGGHGFLPAAAVRWLTPGSAFPA